MFDHNAQFLAHFVGMEIPISLCAAFLLKSGLTPFLTMFCQCSAVGPFTRQWNLITFFTLSAGRHAEEHSGKGFMLKQISCPSVTTLVRCVVQMDEELGALGFFLGLWISSDSELELELELEDELELESELEPDSDDDEEEDDDDDEEDDEDEESLSDWINWNPLALAFLGFWLPITSVELMALATHCSCLLLSFSCTAGPSHESSVIA